MSLGPQRVWITIKYQLDNKTAKLRDTTELWYGIVWYSLIRCFSVWSCVRCGLVSFSGCGIVWYGFV